MRELDVEALSNNVKSCRVKAGYTQKKAAEALKISESSYKRWEKAPHKVKINKIAELAALYHTSVNSFFTGM